MHLRHFSGHRAYAAGEPCPDLQAAAGRCRNPSTSLLALSASYASSRGWTASLHVNNLTDRRPVDHDDARAGYNPSFDDPVGRHYAVELRYRF